ncbi:methionine--tRNA ligase [bacterium]|nr:methionine--tRNA ligase [bacterium]
MSAKKFYITTTLPYVNAEPHMGHGREFVVADALARHARASGREVFFNTGTDEHGVKIYRKALEQRKDPQEYVDEYAEKFKALKETLNVSYDNFIRTTDPHHKSAAQEFWRRCEKAGDIYKKNYKIKYCVGCELEKTESELLNGRCAIHTNQELELIDEENYFFRFSKYRVPLLDLYTTHPDFVIPNTRLHEIKSFVERGLQDFSISRVKEKMPWGVPVPGDESQVMYVWFDAFVNYISTLGWPEDEKKFTEFWGTKENPNAVQIAGKDNLRQQSAMWQAMLMSAGLPRSKQIIILGFITSGGVKMSKSLGNVIHPADIVKEFGTDALRFFLLHELSMSEDGDFTREKFIESYNANLANGLGNLVSRIMKMAVTHLPGPVSMPASQNFPEEYSQALEGCNTKEAIECVFGEVSALDREIQRTEPFKLIKTEPEQAKQIIHDLAARLFVVGRMLEPFLPRTAKEIECLVHEHTMPEKPLFARL